MAAYFLTTIDNPFDPVDDFDNWYNYDVAKGYNSCAYLARIASTSSNFTDAENQRIINDAVDEICRLDILGIYKRIVVKDDSVVDLNDDNVAD